MKTYLLYHRLKSVFAVLAIVLVINRTRKSLIKIVLCYTLGVCDIVSVCFIALILWIIIWNLFNMRSHNNVEVLICVWIVVKLLLVRCCREVVAYKVITLMIKSIYGSVWGIPEVFSIHTVKAFLFRNILSGLVFKVHGSRLRVWFYNQVICLH